MENKGTQNGNDQVRILIVDDEPGMRDMLCFELGSSGFRTDTASNGLEAIERIKEKEYHLVISDIKMPVMDGIAALKKIKEIAPQIEVIMATGFGTIETAVEAMKMGAYDFVQKPYNIDEIRLVIEKALEKSELKALVALHEASQAVFSTIKIDELLDIVMGLMRQVLRADEGSVMLLDSENKLYIAASHGIQQEVARSVHLEIGHRVAGHVADKKRPYRIINGISDHPEFKGIKNHRKIYSSIVCPLLYQGKLLGVLNLNRTLNKEHFSEADVQSASIFASQVAQAVQNANLYKSLEEKMKELKSAYERLEETQNQLVESEKLASLGRLVAGVAHEINNPLTSVMGYTEIIIETHQDPETKEQLNIIFREAERCRKIVQDLLVFARRRKPNKKMINVYDLIEEGIEALALEFKKQKIQVIKNLPKTCPEILLDPHQIGQVFLNILSNARGALKTKQGEKCMKIGVEIKETTLQVSFADNGSGIKKENLSKIFDPFFTTKDVGSGTGLGLSLCYGIIKEHKGRILVDTEEGQGTTFTIELPLSDSSPVSTTEPKSSPKEKRKPSLSSKREKESSEPHTILLVDDEKSVVTLVKEILEKNGYQIDIAFNGQEAFQKIQKRNFDVIICDYRMPKMNGKKFYEKAGEWNAQLKDHFLFITGSLDFEEGATEFLRDGKHPLLCKPFKGRDLLNMVEEQIKHVRSKPRAKGKMQKGNE